MLVHDVQQWIQMQVFRPPFFIEHLLPRGGNLLIYGQTGVMKSWLVQHMAFCIATGTEWLGFQTTQARILLANFEISSPSYHYRLQLMSQNFALEPMMFYVTSPSIMFLEEPAVFDRFKEAVESVAPQVIVLDCLSACFGGDENSSQEMSRLMRNLSELRGEERSMVIVHHSNKNYQNPSPIDRSRGHSKLPGWVDSILYFVDQPTCKQLQFSKVRHAPFLIHSKNIHFEGYLWSEGRG